ncbi:hypothetical protein ACQR0V_29680 [Bradyrhizobium sp. HKCCYLS2058]|uniref:hypothetical protein n=1 Tax=Bradyrhizobium TaxID=374 RepID=UPI0028E734A0|nr:hypothetical protein [Bradyrhizobium sp. SZCCHNS3002]
MPTALPVALLCRSNKQLVSSGKSLAHFRASLLPHEGRFATVTNRWQWDAMGVYCRSVDQSARTNGDARTVKSRGPDIPTLISTHAGAFASRGDGGQKARRTRENAKQPLKPIAQGGPGRSG